MKRKRFSEEQIRSSPEFIEPSCHLSDQASPQLMQVYRDGEPSIGHARRRRLPGHDDEDQGGGTSASETYAVSVLELRGAGMAAIAAFP